MWVENWKFMHNWVFLNVCSDFDQKQNPEAVVNALKTFESSQRLYDEPKFIARASDCVKVSTEDITAVGADERDSGESPDVVNEPACSEEAAVTDQEEQVGMYCFE